MSMLDEFVEKYSSILNGRDVIELFGRLTELSSRAEASRICELERRTTYYWDEERAVRLVTKQKVLRAILEKDFDFAVKYLVSRVYTASSDMLELYLGTIYEKAMDAQINVEQFQKLIENFRKMRIEYSALINPRTNARIYQMFMTLQHRAKERNVNLPPLPMSTMDMEEISMFIPRLMKILPRSISNNDLINYSRKFNISQDFLKFVSDLKSLPKLTPEWVAQRDGTNATPIYRGILEGVHVLGGPISSDNYDIENLERPEMMKFVIESASPKTIDYLHLRSH